MFLDYTDNWFSEAFKGILPVHLFILVPLLLAFSPVALCSQEYLVYRMQHYDLQGVQYGSRSASISGEAVLFSTLLTNIRRSQICLMRLADAAHLTELVQRGIGAIVIAMPNLTTADTSLMEVEHSLMEEEHIPVPVYFIQDGPETEELFEMVGQNSGAATRSVIYTLWHSTSIHFYMSVAQPRPISNPNLVSYWGRLSGFGLEEQLPTVAFVAHYDGRGLAPHLSFGADSNGSGVSALLELLRVFYRLYSQSKTHPRFNLLFVLAAAGKWNYLGTKKFIEDSVDLGESSLLQDAWFTVCLDSLGSPGTELFAHVSKPPKDEKLPMARLLSALNAALPTNPVRLVHKKINLADEKLAWEHERFSIQRVERQHIAAWSDYLSKTPRSAQLLIQQPAQQSKAAAPVTLDDSLLFLRSLEQHMQRHLKEVKKSIFTPDKREPEVVFYDVFSATMAVYQVKSALFDLAVSCIIAAYLGSLYFGLLHWERVRDWVRGRRRTTNKIR